MSHLQNCFDTLKLPLPHHIAVFIPQAQSFHHLFACLDRLVAFILHYSIGLDCCGCSSSNCLKRDSVRTISALHIHRRASQCQLHALPSHYAMVRHISVLACITLGGSGVVFGDFVPLHMHDVAHHFHIHFLSLVNVAEPGLTSSLLVKRA